MDMFKKSYLFFLIFFLCTACQKDNKPVSEDDRDLPVVIIHDNDVHCYVDGYSQFAGFRDAIVAADTAFVVTLSSGDFVQGEFIGGFSKGSYLIDIMKNVGYDAVTVGNHEFDYGIDRLKELLGYLGTDKVTCANFINTDTRKSVYAPYIIKKCGAKKIALVGVVSPATMVTDYYAFKEGETTLPYDISDSQTVSQVQEAVNDARLEGADYVVLLSHMGDIKDPDCELYAISLINQTTGIDIVLDGHTHSVIPEQTVKNLEGKDVLLTQTGTKFSHFGKVTISKTGSFHSECIPDSLMKKYSNVQVQHTIDSVQALCSASASEIIGHTSFELTINDESGQRLVRKGETNLCDLVTDAFLYVGDGRVSFANGGSIRTSIDVGDITFGDVVNVLPFENVLTDFEISGKQIREVLESSFQYYPEESGALLHVSGLKYTYDSSKSPHICDIQVMNEDETYTPISESVIYKATTTEYILNDFTNYPAFEGCKRIRGSYIIEYNALKQYILDIGGEIPDRYISSQNRVTVK